MKITVTGLPIAGKVTQPFVIVDDNRPREQIIGAQGLDIAEDFAVEPVEYVDADEVVFFERALESNTLTFTAYRPFPSPVHAIGYLLALRDTVPRQGTVMIEEEAAGRVFRRTLPNAIVKILNRRRDGPLTWVDWQIMGGKFVKA